jgi:glutaredoxin
MKKFFLPIFILIIFTLGLAGCAKNNNNGGTVFSGTGTVLYTSDTCPHCKIVKDFLAANDPDNKAGLEQKEVSKNQANALELLGRAVDCGLDRNNVGVPLLWVSGKCYSGSEEIINFVKEKIK